MQRGVSGLASFPIGEVKLRLCEPCRRFSMHD